MKKYIEWTEWKQKWYLPILGIVLLSLGYLAWGLFTISYRNETFEKIAFLLSIAVVICFGQISYNLGKREKDNSTRTQWNVVCVIAAVCSILLLIRGAADLWREKEFFSLLIEVLWCAVSLYSVLLLHDKGALDVTKIRIYLKENVGVILLLVVTLVLCAEPNVLQYKWDGLLYYLTGKNLSMKSLSSLAVYGHIAQTFGALVQVGNIVFGNTGIAMFAVNLGLMILSIIYFYGIILYCLPNRPRWIYALVTAMYAWSPYLLGLVPYYNLDFACQCLVAPVLYYFIRRKWVLLTFFSILFCFTKEPAILVYGTLCAGTVIIDIISDRKVSMSRRIANCFGRTQYYIMALPGILWLATYKMLGPWSAGNGGVDFDVHYIVEKLKNLYILNFNWVFAVMIVAGAILLLLKRDYEAGKMIFPLICAQAVFTLFSCFFNTVNHPRYNDTNQVILYLLAIILAGTYIKQAVCVGLSILMSFLMLLSSFYTIDPVSLSVYPTYQIGKTIMLSTGDVPLGDAMIYNRQMLGMEKALEMAVASALDDNTMVCFPAVNSNPYYFDGMAAVEEITECRFDTEYWDTKRLMRVPEGGENTIEFTVCQIPDCVKLATEDLDIRRPLDLIYMDCAGGQLYDKMRDAYSLVKEEDYAYEGWIIHRARFD